MNRLTKTFSIFVYILLLLAVIGWIIVKSIKPEVIKEYVSLQLTALTHQPSQVNGEVSWQIFPHPGVKLTSVQIGEENKTRYAVNLENLRFDLKIMPLLRGKLVFNELNVNGFNVGINLSKDGQFNAPERDLPIKEIPAKELPSKDVLAKKSSNISEKFAIERILLSRGQVTILQDHEKTTISNLQIGAEQFNFQQEFFPIQLRANLDVNSKEEKKIAAFANFKGRIALSHFVANDALDRLKDAALKGQLVIENLELPSLKINKLTTNIKTKPGTILFNPLTINLYNGESVGDLSYDLDTKKFLFNQTATNLDGNKLVYDLSKNNSFRGGIDFSMHAQGDLRQKNWKDKLFFKGNVTVKEGAVQLINLEKVIFEMANKMSAMVNKVGHAVPQGGQLTDLSPFKGDVHFRLLTLQYSLHDEKLRSDSFILQTNNLQLKGEGELNLAERRLNSRLLATVNLDDPRIIKVQQSLGGSFPLLIKGTIEQPTILPNLKVMAPMLTKIWLKQTLLGPLKKSHDETHTVIANKEQK